MVGTEHKQTQARRVRAKAANLLSPGTLVDHYEIIRPIGAGGMGQVFLARDVKLGRLVALKVLFPTNREVATRMLIEARATAKCTHENIVVIHDMNEHQGMPYLVLEYMEGAPLRMFTGEERLPLIRVVEVMVAVSRALEHAHAAGIIHRDLKPDNVFLTSSGVVKVLDFGIAKLNGAPSIDGLYAVPTPASDDETHITISGDGPVGTRMFMSPEQWASVDVDGRTDVWAAGVMLFQLLSGEYPFQNLEAAALMFAVMSPVEPVRSITTVVPNLHAGLAQIIDQCLRKDREERLTAGELRRALESLLPSRASQSDGRCPYPGLEAFQESDAERFFGRADQVARVCGRLRTEPFLAIVGPSGVGKSSFIRAGVVPTLKTEARWESIVLRPGRQPLLALATAIAPPNADREYLRSIVTRLYEEPGFLGAVLRRRANDNERKVLLFVDQFEELYTLCPDPNMRRSFVTSLHAAADDASSPVRVIISLRSDFLDRPAEDPAFMATLTDGIHYLLPLGREGLWHALVRPAEQVNHVFESHALVGQMLDEMASSSNALPLLQFAAARMWEVRDRARCLLTAASYAAMGGIVGALAVHADTVLAELSFERRRLAQLVFQRLVTPEGTRAIVDLDELVTLSHDPTAVRGLVDALVSARLLVSKSDDQGVGATVEIVHESLIVAWPQLRMWAEAGREEATFLTSLRHAAQQWESRGCPTGLLWRGDAADEARRFSARLGTTIGPRERRYLDAVIGLASRSSRIRRFAVAATMIVLGAVVIAGSIILVKVRTAEHEAVRQATEARAAKSELADQLKVVQDKEAARLAAEKQAAEAEKTAAVAGEEAEMSRAELQKANAQLAKTLAAARRSSEQEKALRIKVEGLLEAEKRHSKGLAKQRDKMARDLR
ncbi:MAG: protein kinase domain-containing protein [Kofleriaceae bacterium]